LLKVATAVLGPGAALALSSVGFGVMAAFSILLFVERGWRPAWLAYTLFALSFVAARVIFGHLPDRQGGARIAALFGTIEAVGFAALWVAPWSWLGFGGAALVGFGYSLVFPGPPRAREVARARDRNLHGLSRRRPRRLAAGSRPRRLAGRPRLGLSRQCVSRLRGSSPHGEPVGKLALVGSVDGHTERILRRNVKHLGAASAVLEPALKDSLGRWICGERIRFWTSATSDWAQWAGRCREGWSIVTR
jgi:hypothetical protein